MDRQWVEVLAMSYRTVLVHLTSDIQARSLLAMALHIARPAEAHVIGLYVFPAYRISPPIPLPFGAEVAGNIRRTINEDSQKVLEVFKAATDKEPVVAEWRSVTTEHRDAAEIVMEHARIADLVIAGQADPANEFSAILDFPDRLAIETGRPVLVLPAGYVPARLPRSITVAWKNRRESARAVFDALPLLKQAERVDVVTIEEDSSGREGRLPDTEMGAALARHGIKATIASARPSGHLGVGEDIRRYAVTCGADLLVMGAYGHSRFREMAFGGATRHIFRDMNIPVLFSH
jgi:nucleotide-binding universal stress UspA family protein